jgi:RecB family endonuclease NucS
LLAVAQDGSLVVIELKVSKGHDRTIGQILTYMGWVRQDLAEGKPVRGMIVAHTLSDELLTAAQEAKTDIHLFEYDISFRLRPRR